MKGKILTIALITALGLSTRTNSEDLTKHFSEGYTKSVSNRYDNNKFASIDWVVPDTAFFGLKRGTYTLNELKNTPSNLLLLRALEEPTLGFDRTIIPESLNDKLSDWRSFKMGINRNVEFGAGWQVDENHSLKKQWDDLFDYLTDNGVAFKDHYHKISHLFFTANYNNLQKAFDRIDFPKDQKEGNRKRLKLAHMISKKVMEFRAGLLKGLYTLKEAESLKNKAPKEDPFFAYWMNSHPHMSLDHICSELRIRNRFLTRSLTLERMTDLLGVSDTSEAKEKLSKLSATEAIAFSEYFSRSRIQKYGQDKDGSDEGYLQNMLGSKKNKNLVFGDCTDFAALSAYALKEVIQPINKNLEGWYFGARTESEHRYLLGVKMYDYYGETKLGIVFFDPTKLASERVEDLDYDIIIKNTDATLDASHFIRLPQYFADLVKHNIDPDAAFRVEIGDLKLK